MDKLTLFYKYLQFADTAFFLSLFFFLTNGRFVATLGQAGLLAPFSQQPLLPSCLCHISVILAVSHTLLIITIFVTWSVIFVLLQLTEVSDDG